MTSFNVGCQKNVLDSLICVLVAPTIALPLPHQTLSPTPIPHHLGPDNHVSPLAVAAARRRRMPVRSLPHIKNKINMSLPNRGYCPIAHLAMVSRSCGVVLNRRPQNLWVSDFEKKRPSTRDCKMKRRRTCAWRKSGLHC